MSDLAKPSLSLLDPYTGSDILPLYTTSVTVTGGSAGHGRASGHARSDDGALDLHLRLPRALGGPGGGTNPEQLFAAGYAACFHGALNLIAAKHKRPVQDATVEVSVTFGRDPADGLFLLTAEVEVSIPGVDADTAEALVRETQAVCPYSKLTRQGARSSLRLVRRAA